MGGLGSMGSLGGMSGLDSFGGFGNLGGSGVFNNMGTTNTTNSNGQPLGSPFAGNMLGNPFFPMGIMGSGFGANQGNIFPNNQFNIFPNPLSINDSVNKNQTTQSPMTSAQNEGSNSFMSQFQYMQSVIQKASD